MLDPDLATMLQRMHDNGEPPLFQDVTAEEARRRGVHVRARYYPPVLMESASATTTRCSPRTSPTPPRCGRPGCPRCCASTPTSSTASAAWAGSPPAPRRPRTSCATTCGRS